MRLESPHCVHGTHLVHLDLEGAEHFVALGECLLELFVFLSVQPHLRTIIQHWNELNEVKITKLQIMLTC